MWYALRSLNFLSPIKPWLWALDWKLTLFRQNERGHPQSTQWEWQFGRQYHAKCYLGIKFHRYQNLDTRTIFRCMPYSINFSENAKISNINSKIRGWCQFTKTKCFSLKMEFGSYKKPIEMLVIPLRLTISLYINISNKPNSLKIFLVKWAH